MNALCKFTFDIDIDTDIDNLTVSEFPRISQYQIRLLASLLLWLTFINLFYLVYTVHYSVCLSVCLNYNCYTCFT